MGLSTNKRSAVASIANPQSSSSPPPERRGHIREHKFIVTDINNKKKSQQLHSSTKIKIVVATLIKDKFGVATTLNQRSVLHMNNILMWMFQNISK
jgi:hypothetical protein